MSQSVLLEELTSNSEDYRAYEKLTDREVEVIRAMFNPALNRRQIADLLCISEGTTRNHMVSIYSKLGVDNRELAVRVFCQLNPQYVEEATQGFRPRQDRRPERNSFTYFGGKPGLLPVR